MNAIILAAVLGSRMVTSQVPKPLIKVDGKEAIIERQIRYLNEIGITDIHIVVGYRHNEFSYLKSKHNANMIFNPYFNSINNIYSMFLAWNTLEIHMFWKGMYF